MRLEVSTVLSDLAQVVEDLRVEVCINNLLMLYDIPKEIDCEVLGLARKRTASFISDRVSDLNIEFEQVSRTVAEDSDTCENVA